MFLGMEDKCIINISVWELNHQQRKVFYEASVEAELKF